MFTTKISIIFYITKIRYSRKFSKHPESSQSFLKLPQHSFDNGKQIPELSRQFFLFREHAKDSPIFP